MPLSTAYAGDWPTAIARKELQDTASPCGEILADIARMLWPNKTAAHLAAASGNGERAAEYWLAGKYDMPGDAVAAIVAEVLRRHGMRNARVVARR